MDYTIYIALAILAILYFVFQGQNRKKKRDRKSRKFMEGHRMEDRNKSIEEEKTQG